MQRLVKMLITTIFANAILLSHAVAAPSRAEATKGWALPRGLEAKGDPRSYRFTIDYVNADGKGETLLRQHLSGDYTRLPNGEAQWNDVTQQDAPGASGPFGSAQKRDFMAPFRYRNRLADTMKPEFFASFPPMALAERNLVWDTGMIEYLGQGFFERLELNVPFHVRGAGDVHMPGIGTFENRDIVLEWVGRSRLNGEDCAVLSYQAFLNPLHVTVQGMDMQGRSEYWGQIWVSIRSKQIERATLNEIVVGQLKLAGQAEPQVVNVFRSGVLQPVAAP